LCKPEEQTECPDESAISRKFEKTKGTVRAFGLKSVFWLFLEFYRPSKLVWSGLRQVTAEYHCHEPKIAFFLKICFDCRKTPSCRLADGLDEQALANTQFDTDIIWA
jgi:hypothetical protein